MKIPFFINELGSSNPALAGMALATATLASGTASMVFMKVKNFFGQTRLVAVGLGLMALGQFIVSTATTTPQTFIGLVLVGLGLGLTLPNMTLWLMALTPPHLRGRLMGGLTTAIFLGQFISPAFARLLSSFGSGSIASIFAVSSAVLLVTSLGFGLASLRPKPV